MSLQLQNSVNWPDRFHAISFPPSLSQGRFESSGASHTADAVRLSPSSRAGDARTHSFPTPPKKAAPLLGEAYQRRAVTLVLSRQLFQPCLRLLETGASSS